MGMLTIFHFRPPPSPPSLDGIGYEGLAALHGDVLNLNDLFPTGLHPLQGNHALLVGAIEAGEGIGSPLCLCGCHGLGFEIAEVRRRSVQPIIAPGSEPHGQLMHRCELMRQALPQGILGIDCLGHIDGQVQRSSLPGELQPLPRGNGNGQVRIFNRAGYSRNFTGFRP